MKYLSILTLLLASCSLLNPSIKSPCDNLYCVSLEVTDVPGAGLLCYQTAEARDRAVARLRARGVVR